MNLNRFTAALLLSAVALTACEKNGVQVITAPTAGAFVRFANFGVSAPGVNFYANDKKITAVSTTTCTVPTDPACLTTGLESTTGVASGAFAVTSGLYFSMAPGAYTLSGKIAAATDKDLAIASTPVTLENGKFYTYYTSGIYDATAKKVDAFIVEDVIPTTIDPATAYVRFVNAIPNSSPMTLFAKNTTTSTELPVGGVTAYKTGTAFVALPLGIYDLNTRTAGSSTNVISRAAVSFVGGRVYTITARGDITVGGTTDARRPQLDFTASR